MNSQADYVIHESSCVDEGAHIGAGTHIWHFCHIESGAQIGTQCQLGQNVYVAADTQIGSHVKIQNNVSVYSGVVLEDEVFVGPSVVFTNVLTPRATHPGSSECRSTIVRRGASLGANATILCGHTIGEYALIGAGAVITHDVPAHAVVYGNPARQRGWACQCGCVLQFHGPLGSCTQCGRRYRQTVSAKIEPVTSTQRAA